MAEKKIKKASGAPKKRRKVAGKSAGLEAKELVSGAKPSLVIELEDQIDTDGGKVLAVYREPFGTREASAMLIIFLGVAVVKRLETH